jgi:hypothetical protein
MKTTVKSFLVWMMLALMGGSTAFVLLIFLGIELNGIFIGISFSCGFATGCICCIVDDIIIKKGG